MEQLKTMKQNLTSLVQAQIGGNLHEVDAKELGEAVDMIKDLAEAIYYCTVTEAMEKKDEEPRMYYTPMYPPYYPEKRWDDDTMYYTEPRFRSSMGQDRGMASRPYESNSSQPMTIRDAREGRSPMSRKNYMESKELHQDKSKVLKDLEQYLQELSLDISEMIQQATPEEKVMLQQKIAALASKIK